MRILAILVATLGLSGAIAVPALAQDNTIPQLDFATLDADQSGGVSEDELKAAVPDITDDQFAAADTDGNGELSQDELAAYAASMQAGN